MVPDVQGAPSWQQGFPSSHAATAAGLTIVLSRIYPHGRWLFILIACAGRISTCGRSVAFLERRILGAAVACLFAPLCVYGSRISRLFDKIEADNYNPIALPAVNSTYMPASKQSRDSSCAPRRPLAFTLSLKRHQTCGGSGDMPCGGSGHIVD